jgi:predicted DNA-binding transcriptional regulator AlpA
VTGAVIVTDEAALRRVIADEVAKGVQPLQAEVASIRADLKAPASAMLDLDGVARYLSLNTRTVRRMIRLGQIPEGARIGSKVLRWRLADLDRWLDSGAPPLPSSRLAGSCGTVRRNRRS